MESLPFEIIDLMIQCFGRCFHYKDGLEAFLITSGVRPSIVRKYKHEAKFIWARKILLELGESEEGKVEQRKLLNALNNLRNLPDPNVEDKNAGLSALRTLKESIKEHSLIVKENKNESNLRKQLAEQKTKLVSERANKLDELRNTFTKGLTATDRQVIGFTLEDILKDLFALFEIEYKKSYKTDTQQIDGHFKFQGFNYLVEAKWRKDQPNEGEIGAFQRKVKTKLESTRGLFISISGFRDEVINQFNGSNNIIMLCGLDLTYLLEGRIDLNELLNVKIDKAAQYGICYYPSYKIT
jgi:hypothetical protein